jgi:membrane-associated phospholipid phosphatase
MTSTARGEPRHHRPYRRFSVGVLVAIVVTAASWVAVTRSTVSPGEEQVFRLVNEAPDWWWPVLWPPMQLGTVGAPLVVAGAAAMALRRWRPAVAAVLAGAGAWAAAQAVKGLVVRARPDVVLSDVVQREGTHGLGFVSGHAAIATALVTVVWPYLTRPARVLAGALVALVGIGRMYVGAHLPLDVVGGAAIGALAGLAANALLGLPLHDQPSAPALADAEDAPRT